MFISYVIYEFTDLIEYDDIIPLINLIEVLSNESNIFQHSFR